MTQSGVGMIINFGGNRDQNFFLPDTEYSRVNLLGTLFNGPYFNKKAVPKFRSCLTV